MNALAEKYGTAQRQTELLKMMKDIDPYLTSHGVAYSLCGGTLLGAVREKGFIPWDDDIDIMVDRENLNKIKQIFTEKPLEGYHLQRFLWVERIRRDSDPGDDLTTPTIDVFVMDPIPDNRVLASCKMFLIKMLQGTIKKDISYKDVSAIYKICLGATHLIGLPFSDKKKNKWYDAVSQIGSSGPSEYLGMYDDLFKYLKLKYTKNTFKEINRYPFEDMLLPVTSEYDNYLSTVYGDYMTPPEDKDRMPIHMI